MRLYGAAPGASPISGGKGARDVIGHNNSRGSGRSDSEIPSTAECFISSPPEIGGATGMTNRLEVKILTRDPDVGNPTPKTRAWLQSTGASAATSRTGAREGRSGGSRRCMTVQAKAKRRKACEVG